MLAHHNLVLAQQFWAEQPIDARKGILSALTADATLADHEFAALPPQVQAGIFAGLAPPSSDTASADEDTHSRGRRRKSDDD